MSSVALQGAAPGVTTTHLFLGPGLQLRLDFGLLV